jgi:hypothetical protein
VVERATSLGHSAGLTDLALDRARQLRYLVNQRLILGQ